MIVENRPGAGGLVALNGVYMAPADGLTIMIVNGTGAAFSQLTDQQGARYDLGKIGYVATLSAPPSLWTVGPHFGVKTITEALKADKKWRWAASGPVDSLSDGAAFTCEALKLDCQIVLGYKGSNDAALAVSRGEMDALYVTDTSANHYAQADGLIPLATVGRNRSRFFPELPTIFEATTSQRRSGMAVRLPSRGPEPRPHPGGATRNDRTAGWRSWKQPPRKPSATRSFLAEGDKRQLYTDYVDAAGTRKNAMSIVTKSPPSKRSWCRTSSPGRGERAGRS